MQAVNDVGIAIAETYARALMALAGDDVPLDDLLEEFDGFVAYINATPEFESFLVDATIDADARAASLEKTLRGRMADLLLDFLQVLNRKDRLPLVEQIFIQSRLANEALKNQVEVTVSTPTSLSDSVRESLVSALKAYAGRDPILTECVEPGLLGGLVVHIGDKKLDFSVVNKLRRFRKTLDNRASREIQSGRSYVQD